MTFQNKVAVVTGASQGIGRATAIALGKAGAKVAVNYRSNREKANDVVREIEASGSEAFAFEADVSDHDAVEAIVKTCVERYGKIDVAVSNAAYSDREVFYDADLDGFRRTIDVTMWGACLLYTSPSPRDKRQSRMPSSA